MDDKLPQGKFYWRVKVPTTISLDGEITFYADNVYVTPSSGLSAYNGNSKEKNYRTVIGLAPGTWTAVFPASIADGQPVTILHWPGVVSSG